MVQKTEDLLYLSGLSVFLCVFAKIFTLIFHLESASCQLVVVVFPLKRFLEKLQHHQTLDLENRSKKTTCSLLQIFLFPLVPKGQKAMHSSLLRLVGMISSQSNQAGLVSSHRSFVRFPEKQTGFKHVVPC